MVRRLIYIVFIGAYLSSCSSRTIVDYPALSILVDIHTDEHKRYKQVKNEEIQKTGLQSLLNKEQYKLTELTQKLQKRYKTVSSIIHSVGRVPYALDIMNDIKKYQVKIQDYVVDDPKLLALAVKTEIAVLKKINRLYKYVYANAVIGTDFNLMTVEQRLQIIDYVIEELRDIRGMVYGVEVRIRYAKKGDVWKKILQEHNINLFNLSDFEKEMMLKDMKIW